MPSDIAIITENTGKSNRILQKLRLWFSFVAFAQIALAIDEWSE